MKTCVILLVLFFFSVVLEDAGYMWRKPKNGEKSLTESEGFTVQLL